jgi:histone deacetylase complex regulatory component SIN3
MKRLSKALDLLEQIVDENSEKDEKEKEAIINKIVGLGGLQMIYKNSHRDQKEELEWFLKTADVDTCRLFKERLMAQLNELKNIKDIHAIKNWSEVANKNFFKALDVKGFEFKKNEK